MASISYKDVRLRSRTKERLQIFAAKSDCSLNNAVNLLLDMAGAE